MPRWSKDPPDTLKVGRGTLRKRARGRMWYCQYRDAVGRWTIASTHHNDKPGAIEWATAPPTRVLRIETGTANPDDKVSNDPIRVAIDEFRGYIEKQRKPNTLKTYRKFHKEPDRLPGYPADHPAAGPVRHRGGAGFPRLGAARAAGQGEGPPELQEDRRQQPRGSAGVLQLLR